MSIIRLSWGKVSIFIIFFAASTLIFFVQAMAASENAQVGAQQVGAQQVGAQQVGAQQVGAHESLSEGEQPGGHEGGQAEGEGHGADRSATFAIFSFVSLILS